MCFLSLLGGRLEGQEPWAGGEQAPGRALSAAHLKGLSRGPAVPWLAWLSFRFYPDNWLPHCHLCGHILLPLTSVCEPPFPSSEQGCRPPSQQDLDSQNWEEGLEGLSRPPFYLIDG